MRALLYHDATKHHFNRFARSLGYLDWATQPNPFRRFADAPRYELPRRPLAERVPYSALFSGQAPVRPLDERSIGEFLRCSMGLSAWKQYGSSRWSLRVNPSSGNLHPTEAYVITGARVRGGDRAKVREETEAHSGEAPRAGVFHYDVARHALEQRCELDAAALPDDVFFVALTSIHWREAWKYGERAFRYCQHDCGHAIGALRMAAALLGWRLVLLPRWTHEELAAVTGVDRDDDFQDAEREEPECIAVVGPGDVEAWCDREPESIVAAARAAAWSGHANRLSPDHVEWPIIDEVAQATRVLSRPAALARTRISLEPDIDSPQPLARSVILRRRSAVAFDARSELPREVFFRILQRLQPDGVPFDAIDWPPQVHLVLFVHRVTGLTPGLYAWLRDPAVLDDLRSAMRPEFMWEPIPTPPYARTAAPSEPDLAPSRPAPSHPASSHLRALAPSHLYLLTPFDLRPHVQRLSCDQDIAADGFFSLGMLARFEPALVEYGEPFYRRLFWEAGLIGQVLYLEAEASGVRGTGIGCYYDEPVHELLGLTGHAWQSLYHFTVGMPVEDARLSSEPGYPWEADTARG